MEHMIALDTTNKVKEYISEKRPLIYIQSGDSDAVDDLIGRVAADMGYKIYEWDNARRVLWTSNTR